MKSTGSLKVVILTSLLCIVVSVRLVDCRKYFSSNIILSLLNKLLKRLPPRMRQICVSLLKTIQEYDEAMMAAEESVQGSDHIFSNVPSLHFRKWNAVVNLNIYSPTRSRLLCSARQEEGSRPRVSEVKHNSVSKQNCFVFKVWLRRLKAAGTHSIEKILYEINKAAQIYWSTTSRLCF